MKIALQYVCDANGNAHAVQVPIADWERIVAKLQKYEQTSKLKADLTEALQQVAVLRAKKHKQTLTEFLTQL